MRDGALGQGDGSGGGDKWSESGYGSKAESSDLLMRWNVACEKGKDD